MLQGADDRDLFAVAERKLGYFFVRVKLQPFAEPRGFFRAIAFSELRGILYHLADFHSVIEICLGGHIADIGESIGFSGILAENFRRSARLGNQPRKYSDSGAFPRAVGSDKTKEVALGYRQSNIVYPSRFAVKFRKRRCFDRVHYSIPLFR